MQCAQMRACMLGHVRVCVTATGVAPASGPDDVHDALEDFRREALHLIKGVRRAIVSPLVRRHEAAATAAEEEAQVRGLAALRLCWNWCWHLCSMAGIE